MAPFIKPDEWNFLMDNSPCWSFEGPEAGLRSVSLSLDELKMIRYAEVQTSLEYVDWIGVEPKRGQYDWSVPDAMVERLRKAGLKGLLMLPHLLPHWMPDDWFSWSKEGRVFSRQYGWCSLSPWNKEAQDYQRQFIQIACGRYNAPDMLCIQSQTMDGDSILPPHEAAIYDPAALKSYAIFLDDPKAMPDVQSRDTQTWMLQSLIALVVSQQRIYCESHPSRTVFLQLHPQNAEQPHSGCFHIVEYWRAIQEALKPDHGFHILFSYFGVVEGPKFINQLDALGVETIVGSEWPEGLNKNTPKALAQGIRGLLTSPTHPYLRRFKVEHWMLDAFRKSRELFMQKSKL